MGFFDGFNLADAISGATGVASLFSNPAKQQYKYQRKLNEQAQKYAVENFNREVSAQYGLTRDNPLLQKEGLQRAGMSTAQIGSNVASSASVNSIDTPDAGSAPSGLLGIQAKQAGVQMLLSMEQNRRENLIADAQKRNIDADTESKLIKNDLDSDSLKFDKILRKAEATFAYWRSENYHLYGGKKEAAEAGLASIREQIAAAEYLFKKPELQIEYLQGKKFLDLLDINIENGEKMGLKLDAEKEASKALRRMYDANANKANQEAVGVALDNRSKAIDVDAKEANKDQFKSNYTQQLKLAARDIDLKNDVIDNEKLMLELEQKFGKDTRDRLRKLANSDTWYDSLSGNVLLWLMDNLKIAGSILPDFK